MKKYITVDVPTHDVNNVLCPWWDPDNFPKIIKVLEKDNPRYKFQQVVTSPGNGTYKEFVIMKRKKSIWDRKIKN